MVRTRSSYNLIHKKKKWRIMILLVVIFLFDEIYGSVHEENSTMLLTKG
jgi:hypothetical protein